MNLKDLRDTLAFDIDLEIYDNKGEELRIESPFESKPIRNSLDLVTYFIYTQRKQHKIVRIENNTIYNGLKVFLK